MQNILRNIVILIKTSRILGKSRQYCFSFLILTMQVFYLSISNSIMYGNTADSSKRESIHWYRGNTHTHAMFSDKNNKNDVPEIAKWYRKSGYDFLLLSEHNYQLTKKKVICHDEAGKPPEFIMLCGLELTGSRHITALGITRYIKGETSLQDAVDKTINAGGIPILNHPEQPPVYAATFIKTKGLNHLEVFNGNSAGDTPVCEKLWDSVLSAHDGRIVYAVASDDNHFKKSKVGKGWIMVDSRTLTKEDIQENIRKGNFYSSTGIFLTDYLVTEKTISIRSGNGRRVDFIGKYGKILKTADGPDASYQIKGNELYIRVRITNNEGDIAWTQPVFIKDKGKLIH